MQSEAGSSPPAALSVTTASSVSSYASISPLRRTESVTYPLPAMLAVQVAAIQCAQASVLAIAERGLQQPSGSPPSARLSR